MDTIKTTPKDFFLYVAGMITLYVSAGSLLALLFGIINAVFADPLSSFYEYGYSSGTRFAIASLCIIFPLYVFISWILRKDVVAHPEKKELWVRRWLTYLNLFVAGSIVAGDLITLLNTFLGGEITTRFALKVLSVLVVAGIVFAYYLYDLRRSGEEKKGVSQALVIGSSLLVLASIVVGFMVMGSPMTARMKKFDSVRISDLQTIQWQVINFYQAKGTLPASIDDLKDPISSVYISSDPETKEAYVFEKTGPLSFKLCATFSRDASNDAMGESSPYYDFRSENNWKHTAGKNCFDRTIDSDMYPVRKDI